MNAAGLTNGIASVEVLNMRTSAPLSQVLTTSSKLRIAVLRFGGARTFTQFPKSDNPRAAAIHRNLIYRPVQEGGRSAPGIGLDTHADRALTVFL